MREFKINILNKPVVDDAFIRALTGLGVKEMTDKIKQKERETA